MSDKKQYKYFSDSDADAILVGRSRHFEEIGDYYEVYAEELNKKAKAIPKAERMAFYEESKEFYKSINLQVQERRAKHQDDTIRQKGTIVVKDLRETGTKEGLEEARVRALEAAKYKKDKIKIQEVYEARLADFKRNAETGNDSSGFNQIYPAAVGACEEYSDQPTQAFINWLYIADSEVDVFKPEFMRSEDEKRKIEEQRKVMEVVSLAHNFMNRVATQNVQSVPQTQKKEPTPKKTNSSSNTVAKVEYKATQKEENSGQEVPRNKAPKKVREPTVRQQKRERKEAAKEVAATAEFDKKTQPENTTRIGNAYINKGDCQEPYCAQVGTITRYCSVHKKMMPKKDKRANARAVQKAITIPKMPKSDLGKLIYMPIATLGVITGKGRLKFSMGMSDRDKAAWLLQETFNIVSGRYPMKVLETLFKVAGYGIHAASFVGLLVHDGLRDSDEQYQAFKDVFTSTAGVKALGKNASELVDDFKKADGNTNSPVFAAALKKKTADLGIAELAALTRGLKADDAIKKAEDELAAAKSRVDAMGEWKSEEDLANDVTLQAEVKLNEEKVLAAKKEKLSAEQLREKLNERMAKEDAKTKAPVKVEPVKIEEKKVEVKMPSNWQTVKAIFSFPSKGYVETVVTGCSTPGCSESVTLANGTSFPRACKNHGGGGKN